MIRNLKALMIASVAMLAMSAMAASVAQAVEFHSSSGAATLTSTPDGTGKTAHQVIDFAGGTITCNTLTAQASIGGTTAAVVQTTSIAYTGNCNFVGQSATLNINGCNYNYHANGEIDIVCSGSNEITFSVPSPVCVLVIPPQSGLGTVTYHNINSDTEVTFEPHLIHVQYTATGAGCPETGTFTNGNLTTGNFIFTAEQSGTMVALKVE